MRLREADLNSFLTLTKRNKILKEVNHALEVVERLNSQIKIWDIKQEAIFTRVVKDELKYLNEGKI